MSSATADTVRTRWCTDCGEFAEFCDGEDHELIDVSDEALENGHGVDATVVADMAEVIETLQRENEILKSRLDGVVTDLERQRSAWAALLDLGDDPTHEEIRSAAITRRRNIRAEQMDVEMPESKIEACRQVAVNVLQRKEQNGRQPMIESPELIERVEIRHDFTPDNRTVTDALKTVANANEDVKYIAGKPGPGVPHTRIVMEPSHDSG